MRPEHSKVRETSEASSCGAHGNVCCGAIALLVMHVAACALFFELCTFAMILADNSYSVNALFNRASARPHCDRCTARSILRAKIKQPPSRVRHPIGARQSGWSQAWLPCTCVFQTLSPEAETRCLTLKYKTTAPLPRPGAWVIAARKLCPFSSFPAISTHTMSTGSVSDAEPAREEAPVAASSASEDILASHSAPTQPEEDAPNETDTAPVDGKNGPS